MNPFEKGLPTVFVIGTPFQMLCALQAIKDFEIRDYKVFITDRVRAFQMEPMLDEFGIKYQYAELSGYLSKKKWLKALFPHGKYKRAFIGHFQNRDMYFEALMNLCFNSCIIYLDDGTATLKLLMGYEKVDYKDKFFVKLSVFSLLKRISFGNSLYTMFYNYNNGMFKYCKKNTLEIYKHGEFETLSQNGVYIIGTNFAGYKRDYSCDIDKLILCMQSMFKYLKTKSDNVYYIPHGCDDGTISKKLCQDYSIRFLKLDRPIETYFIENAVFPCSVYGFTSTALYVLKEIYANLNMCFYNIVPKFLEGTEKANVLYDMTNIYSNEGINMVYIEDFEKQLTK